MQWCGGVTRWSMVVTCWEPSLISLLVMLTSWWLKSRLRGRLSLSSLNWGTKSDWSKVKHCATEKCQLCSLYSIYPALFMICCHASASIGEGCQSSSNVFQTDIQSQTKWIYDTLWYNLLWCHSVIHATSLIISCGQQYHNQNRLPLLNV